MNLAELGWDSFFENALAALDEAGVRPARVAREDKGAYLVLSELGESRARLATRFHRQARSRADLPAVGDWVAVKAQQNHGEATVWALLPRRSCLVRLASTAKEEKTEEQVMAANVDTALLVTGLDGNYNLRRIERYVALGWESGADPVVVLNKADLCDNVDARVSEVEAVAIGVPVHAVSATEDDGLDVLHRYLGKGRTAALLGSSGVGKSTIINRLLGEERQKVKTISSAVGKGVHTTTSRELVFLPAGGMLIDTPGMRAFQAWSDDGAMDGTFDDVEGLMCRCRFSDCRHKTEPGCAIEEALETGALTPERYNSYLRAQRQVQSLARRRAVKARLVERKLNRAKRRAAREDDLEEK